MTSEETNALMTIGEQIDRVNAHHARAHQFAGMALEEAVMAGRELIALKDRIGHNSWGEHVGKLAFSDRQAQRYMKLARDLPQLGAKTTSSSDLPSLHAALTALAAPEEIKGQFIAKIETGETFTAADVKAAREAAKTEAQQDASAEIIKREKAVKKLKAQLAALEADDSADVISDLATQLEAERTARAAAEAKAEAAAKGLTVSPPKIVTKVDPEQAARLTEAERQAAELAAQLQQAKATIKARDEQIAKADETAIRIAGERMASSAPAQFVGSFCGEVTSEYLRRLRGAAAIAQRAPHLFTAELTIPLAEVRELLDQIADACALVDAA